MSIPLHPGLPRPNLGPNAKCRFHGNAHPDFLCGGLTRAEAETLLTRLEDIRSATAHEIEQTLGKVLGYPWYKDDQKNFPGATEADGVSVGEHVAESIAEEAAGRIRDLEARLASVARGTSENAATVLRNLTDAVRAFRNLPMLGRLVKLRATPEYLALVQAWECADDALGERYCVCGPDVPAHDGVCQGCERVIRGCD